MTPNPISAAIKACLAIAALALAAQAQSNPLSIDDVLAIQTVDGASISPASEDIAIAMPRVAGPGEVYGRNSYEIDPSRNDIWLVRRDGSNLRRLTNGEPKAAGYWCPHFSPDGKRLAMLSTAPEGEEPHGGDSARLYVWDRSTDAPRRVSDRAMMTQVRYLGPNPIDVRAAGGSTPMVCRANDENAPFVWLDENRLFAILMPDGERSALVERYAKFHREAARAGSQMRKGVNATVSRSDTRSEAPLAHTAELVIFDLVDGSKQSLGRIPAFPLFGSLAIAVAPDGTRAAVLAPRRAIPPHLVASPRQNFDTWEIEKALFVADLAGDKGVQAVTLNRGAQYPVDLARWSPGSRYIAFRARGDTTRNAAQLWALDTNTFTIAALTPGEEAGGLYPQRDAGEYAYWTDKTQILVRAAEPNGEARMRLVDAASGKSSTWEEPFISSLTQLADGTLAGRTADGLVRFDRRQGAFVPWPDASFACDNDDGGPSNLLWTADGPLNGTIPLDPGARMLAHDCTGLVSVTKNGDGSRISFTPWEGIDALLMERNTHLAGVTRGDRRMIEYKHKDGSTQKMAVMLPPDYDRSKAHPTLFWVYGGFSPRSVQNFFFDPQMSAFYNLELYAGQGYVVVVPSIPVPRGESPSEPFKAIPGGVLPALDELVRLGITDETRVGVFGQSNGGYTVNTLVAQTNRFAAAVSLAGSSELATNHSAFDPAARGWKGVDQDMSANQGIYETALGYRVHPGDNPALYHRNSPLTYVNQINTPLLLIHGELDSRAPLTQVETLYSLLRRRGRPARLLRYWGENHSLANSPANVRDIHSEILAWFDEYVMRAGED